MEEEGGDAHAAAASNRRPAGAAAAATTTPAENDDDAVLAAVVAAAATPTTPAGAFGGVSAGPSTGGGGRGGGELAVRSTITAGFFGSSPVVPPQQQQQQRQLLLPYQQQQQEQEQTNLAGGGGGGAVSMIGDHSTASGMTPHVAAETETATAAGGKKKRKGSKTTTKKKGKGKSSKKADEIGEGGGGGSMMLTVPPTATAVGAGSAASSKNKKRQIKRRGSSSSLVGGGGSKVGGAGGRTPRQQQQQQNSVPTVPVDDDDPMRLTNPLLVPPAVAHQHARSANASAVVALRSQDLWPVVRVPFYQPDTYPLAYLARLLGYRVPFAKQQQPTAAAAAPVPWTAALRATLRSGRDEDDAAAGIYKIPPVGNFARRVWRGKPMMMTGRPKIGDYGDADDEREADDDARVLGETQDPLYVALCNPPPPPPPPNSKSSKSGSGSINRNNGILPITVSQLNRLVPRRSGEIFEPALTCAREMGVLPPVEPQQPPPPVPPSPSSAEQKQKQDEDSKSFQQPQPQQHPQQQPALQQEENPSSVTDGTNGDSSSSNANGGTIPSRSSICNDWTVSSLHAYREANPEMVLPPNLTDPTVCGVCLFQRKIPVAVILYTFEWYPTATMTVVGAASSASGGVGSGGNSDAPPPPPPTQPQGYELVIVFQDVLEAQRGESILKATTTATREQEGLVLTLTALALEHARACHVAYALFHDIPRSRRAFFREHFRTRRQRQLQLVVSAEEEGRKERADNDNANEPEAATVPLPTPPPTAGTSAGAAADGESGIVIPGEEKSLILPSSSTLDDDDKNAGEDTSTSSSGSDRKSGEEKTSGCCFDVTSYSMKKTVVKKTVEPPPPPPPPTTTTTVEPVRKDSSREGNNTTPTVPIENEKQANRTSVATLNNVESGSPDNITLVCDLYKCSYRYAFLNFSQEKADTSRTTAASRTITTGVSEDATSDDVVVAPRRWLARLPTVDDAKSALTDNSATLAVLSRNKKSIARKPSPYLTGAPAGVRSTVVRLRAKLPSNDEQQQLPPPPPPPPLPSQEQQASTYDLQLEDLIFSSSGVQLFQLDAAGREGKPVEIPPVHKNMHIELLRDFELPAGQRQPREPVSATETEKESDIVRELTMQQMELRILEEKMEPLLHKLMDKAIEERLDFEKGDESKKRSGEQAILEQYKTKLERRKEQDLAWHKQLEQDMDAVCDVCNDGEVTPDNQILFCEACNVAVHQMCYGVDRIPEGDYYCKACRYLRRDDVNATRKTGIRLAASQLPICCELCPRKQGAFVRTDTRASRNEEDSSFGRWVHAVCGKWQGLNYVQPPDVLEDVTELKYSFRRLNIKCSLCLGERGGMNQCRHDGCKNWMHVTCALAVGTCEVIHGEDVRGPVAENPWTLMCPEHADVKLPDIPKDAISVESLIETAKEFPPEMRPPPTPIAPKPFNSATGDERNRLLMNRVYEKELLVELTQKRPVGIKCEVCEQGVDHKTRSRCNTCGVIVCVDCSLNDVDIIDGNFRCAGCLFKKEKQKADEEFTPPQCVACCQKGGWLRSAFAKPISRKTLKRREFSKTLFAQQLWVHAVCTYWVPRLLLNPETGKVDCSNVVMTSGKSLVQNTSQCFLCGQRGGLKVKCAHEGCSYMVDGTMTHTVFHVTCARQAGFEVNCEERGRDMRFYAKCYRHGGNEFNLRAKLEDLIEIEKRRAGKTFAREDAPMNFAHASRLLHSAIGVLRVLGWAWSWAELWVDYNSSWEPLLEPGEREEDMTNEELKVVESTRESRCEDARKCKLAAFGAALRNRDYDRGDDFDRESFDPALRAILRTKSLVGPIEEDIEIEFFVRWLTLAYCSKSPLLGVGDDNIEVNQESPFCLHIEDRSPKSVLGRRPLPGSKSIANSSETVGTDIDDFLRTEVITDELLDSLHSPRKPTREGSRRSARAIRSHEDSEPTEPTDENAAFASGEMAEETPSTSTTTTSKSAKKRKRGRPPKTDKAPHAPAAPSTKTSKKRKRSRPPNNETSESRSSTSDSPCPRCEQGPSYQGGHAASCSLSRCRKLGSPSKFETAESRSSNSGSGTAADTETSHTTKLKRGRPLVKKVIEETSSQEPETTDTAIRSPAKKRRGLGKPPKVRSGEGGPPKRGRGRPPKKRDAYEHKETEATSLEAVQSVEDDLTDRNLSEEVTAEVGVAETSAEQDTTMPVKRGPGRPRKKQHPEDDQTGGRFSSGERTAEAFAQPDANLMPPRKRRRKQEVTPVDRKALATNRYDVVKRRQRQPLNRFAVGSFVGQTYEGDELLEDDASTEEDPDSKPAEGSSHASATDWLNMSVINLKVRVGETVFRAAESPVNTSRPSTTVAASDEVGHEKDDISPDESSEVNHASSGADKPGTNASDTKLEPTEAPEADESANTNAPAPADRAALPAPAPAPDSAADDDRIKVI